MAYRDRNLVKKPKPIRLDTYLDEYIAASANMAGVSWSEMVRMMLREAAARRIEDMTHHESDNKQSERI